MEHTEAEYLQIVQMAFSQAVLKALLRSVIDAYGATGAACKRALSAPDRHDGFGTIRRGKINELLRSVCEFHKITFKDEANSAGSAYFLSLFSNNLRLCAHLSARRSKIRSAEIRKMWAAHNRDGRNGILFPSGEGPVPANAVYCAFLLHAPRRYRRDQPAFVDIVIPDRNLRKSILTLSLYHLFPEIAMEVGRVQEPKRAQPKPRKNPRRKDADA
jgi:hypothetical protein